MLKYSNINYYTEKLFKLDKKLKLLTPKFNLYFPFQNNEMEFLAFIHDEPLWCWSFEVSIVPKIIFEDIINSFFKRDCIIIYKNDSIIINPGTIIFFTPIIDSMPFILNDIYTKSLDNILNMRQYDVFKNNKVDLEAISSVYLINEWINDLKITLEKMIDLKATHPNQKIMAKFYKIIYTKLLKRLNLNKSSYITIIKESKLISNLNDIQIHDYNHVKNESGEYIHKCIMINITLLGSFDHDRIYVCNMVINNKKELLKEIDNIVRVHHKTRDVYEYSRLKRFIILQNKNIHVEYEILHLDINDTKEKTGGGGEGK